MIVSNYHNETYPLASTCCGQPKCQIWSL